MNQVCILKNYKDLLEYKQLRFLSSCNNIKTFYFSTLYTTIPHSRLKDRLREFVQLCFIKKNDQRRYKYLVLGRDNIQLLTGSDDNSCFVWPEDWTVGRSRGLRATVQSEGQTKQLLFEEPVYNWFVIPYHI
jgi:hypothetical protein